MNEQDATLAPDVAIDIDETVYSSAVVFRTAYSFTDRAYLWLERFGPTTLRLNLAVKCLGDDARVLEGEFRNALIDFEVRAQVNVEAKLVREAIVAAALKGTGA